ncbi:Molybdopterin converting factor large subunit MoaE [Methanonatronarchaeum thermophilum]|uniref:Molybdopterin converting factor large subunit MoaE n=1 Tax=Methanonatronarchaeum thermophilum TaxID=1927129 RepID=A0A1Y3GDK4_9EURY|nr:molybdopterin synthase [Methanonatronarchaeum thermophilum]OUJ18393.1 Molybdopterin converting factor large subunit MoaE [Methanonatronarchaeum thermophilum]
MKAIAIVGNSNSGKTTLIQKLTQELNGEIGVIKNLHQFDTPEKDTYKLTEKASRVIATTENKTITLQKTENPLEKALKQLQDMDIILVEGHKQSNLPKIVLGQTTKKYKKPILTTLNEKENNIQKAVKAIKNAPEYEPKNPDLTDLINQIKSNPKFNKAGAIGSFVGIVRGVSNDKKVEKLYFEKYSQPFNKTIQEIEQQLKNRDGVIDIKIHHRDGNLKVGEDIVYVVAAASHRQQLFKTLEDGINLVKQKAPIWKKEYTIDGEIWVHDKKTEQQ